MKWTKEQLTEASLVLVKWKSKLAMIEHKYKEKFMRMTYSERMDFKRIHSPLKKKILEMENKFLLNVAGNGVEGESDDPEPPDTHKEKQILRDTI